MTEMPTGPAEATKTAVPTETAQDIARKPHIGFLIGAATASLCAVLAYGFEAEIVALSPGGSPLPFAIALVFCVLIAMGLLLCYRMPRLGNRLLGHDVVLRQSARSTTDGYHFTAGFKMESGVEEKRAASRRLSARQTRRKYARATRHMQADSKTETQA